MKKLITKEFIIGFVIGAVIMSIAGCIIINNLCNNIIELLKDY